MLQHVETTWPETHANQAMQSVSLEGKFPRHRPKIKRIRFRNYQPGTGALTFPGFRHYTIDYALNEKMHQKNHVRMVEWNPAYPKRLPPIVENEEVLGLLVMVRHERDDMIICTNGKNGRIVQLDPETLRVDRSSRWRFRGIVKSLSFLKNTSKPVMFITTKVGPNSTMMYTFDPLTFALYNRDRMKSISSRTAVDDNDRVFCGRENTLLRMRFNERTSRFELDESARRKSVKAEFPYKGEPSGTTPTLIGDHVLFQNNSRPSAEEDITLFSVPKDDFSRRFHCVAPFPKRRTQRYSGFSQTSVNGYEYPNKPGGFVIAYSWTQNRPTSHDTRSGVARVEVKANGALEVDWVDPTTGLKRIGCLAPKSDMLVYNYRVRGEHKLRAVSLSESSRSRGAEYPQPDLLWERSLGKTNYMGIVSAGEKHLVASNPHGLFMVY